VAVANGNGSQSDAASNSAAVARGSGAVSLAIDNGTAVSTAQGNSNTFALATADSR
jgi:hypothetical protein